jgi:hypothetical protein
MCSGITSRNPASDGDDQGGNYVGENELPARFQLIQNLLGDFFQGFEYAGALEGDGFDDGFVFASEFGGQQIDRENVGQVALIELQNIRNLVEVVAVLFQVRHQIVERFDVGVLALLLRIGDEDDAIDAAQNQFAAGVVENLSRDGIEVNAGLEAAHGAEIERKEVEEQRTLGFRGQRDHLPLLLVRGFLVDHLQIRGLAAESGTVVHDLAIDLAGCEVDETQRLSSDRTHLQGRPPHTKVSNGGSTAFISYGARRSQVTQVTPGKA